MAFHLGALIVTSLIMIAFLVAFQIPHAHANNANASSLQPSSIVGPWKQAFATFYEGSATTYGGACGYKDVIKDGYGLDTTALSTVLFKNGELCGACYEIKCNQSRSCKGNQSIFVTATNYCPPNPLKDPKDGGWCNPPREHFDLSKPAYLKIAEYKAGIVPVNYRRVPCRRQGGIKFTITGNPYFYLVTVSNVGGDGDVVGVQVKGDKTPWTSMSRNFGQKWDTNARLQGQALSFIVRTSDGSSLISLHVFPKTWQFGQTFEGRNFA